MRKTLPVTFLMEQGGDKEYFETELLYWDDFI